MAHSTLFWNLTAKLYAKKPVPDQAVYEKKLAVTQEYFRPDMRVLEFGCGTGTTALIHAPLIRDYVALDTSSQMVAIANEKKAKTDVRNLHFQQKSLESYSADEASFDAVLGLSILHLLRDKDTAIQQVFRLLKPGGIFVSSTACIGNTPIWLRCLLSMGDRLGILPHVAFFTRDELEQSIHHAGFRIDYRWAPNDEETYFLVAQKPAV